MDKRRFWRLFVRQFLVLLIVSVGLVAFLYFQHQIPPQTQGAWIRFFVLDVAALVGASALVAWLKVVQERARQRRREQNKP